MIKLKAMAAALFTTAVTLTVPVTEAEVNKAAGSGPNPFTDCGIGAALFPDTHWAAVTSNVIWDLGTTAVTSATASPQTCNGKSVKTAQFIIDNYHNIAEETAYAEGEHLTAMLNVRGCQVSSHAGIISSVRSDMASYLASPAYTDLSDIEKASQYYRAMESGVSQFAGSCSA